MDDELVGSATDNFVAHRNLLFTVAYEMLGSAADAEDVLQETWLRWTAVDTTLVRDPRAYLVRITTRQALNRLRTMKTRKEVYVGEWLPEPLLTAPDVSEDAELAEQVSLAMMVVLETLAPMERAVFVLREVFDLDYDEIAAAVDRTPTAVRQLAYRARQHVDARRPRELVSAQESRDALESFQLAVQKGDIQALLDVLAPDVVLIADGGGLRTAAVRPILGPDKVARFMIGALGKTASAGSVVSAALSVVNASPALVIQVDDEVDGVLAARVESGRIAALYYVRNPEKLGRLSEEAALTSR